ncbi:hypothetical protein [Amycolatopsis sp. NPDC057786]|uniref:hypothetical protein n=1 Tax=Amycolatopsis sp. NPDC057786 TaxID=3346250 RepID=UPI00366D7E5C
MNEALVGIKTANWATVAVRRRVLVIAHNVTTVTRLLDVLPAFENDFRVQVVFTCAKDPFQHGLRELLDTVGVAVIPWAEAERYEFDLVVTASHHGGIADMTGPKVILSHGIGYTKYSPGNRKPETGNRKPETGNRKPETGNRQIFGLSPQWLLYDGEPIAESFILSHTAQLDLLTETVPAAAEKAVVAGDPCYDRILAGLPYRERYREALGSGDRKVVLTSSTWWSNALLGSWPDFLRTLLAALPIDEFQVLAVVHPNVRHGHSPWQLNTWLADCVRSGLVVLSEVDDWQAGLAAADLIVGDHGSVTGYGAALGKPTALAAFGDDDVAPGTAISALGETAPRLDRRRPLLPQVRSILDEYRPGDFAGVAELVTSVPGESLQRLRGVFYRVLGLSEPTNEIPLGPPPAPRLAILPSHRVAAEVHHETDRAGRLVRLTRYPAELRRGAEADPHLSCPDDHPLRSIRSGASVLTGTNVVAGLRAGVVGAVLGEGKSVVTAPSGRRVELSGPGPVEVHASVVRAWLDDGHPLEELAPSITVELGSGRYGLDVTLR